MLELKVNILTYFKQLHISYFESPQFKKLINEGRLQITIYSFIDYAIEKNIRNIDDKPYGSLSGLILKFDFFDQMINDKNISMNKTIHMSPSGNLLTHNKVVNYRNIDEITIICSRYEGIDCRIVKFFNIEEVSIGDYVLYDGDTASFVLLNAIIRHKFIKKVALIEESISSGLVEYDQYTRPFCYKNIKVPDVLRSGNHNKISEWKLENSLQKTKIIRNDLYEKYKNI